MVIFQPARKAVPAPAIMDDGLFDRFGIEEVFGMHNYPGMPIGQFAIRSGPMMASSDTLPYIEGVGGHAARPHFAASILVLVVWRDRQSAWQSIVSRNVTSTRCTPRSSRYCMFQAGFTENVIQQHESCAAPRVRCPPKSAALCKSACARWSRARRAPTAPRRISPTTTGYPVLVNEERKTAFAASVAREVAGKDKVNTECAR